MCEREYVGCPECGATTDAITLIQYRDVIESATLDEDGDIAEYAGDTEYGDVSDERYRCESCSRDFTSLDKECVSEECDCAECAPEEHVEDPADPDAFVMVRRVNFYERTELSDDAPHELRYLNSDRCVLHLPIRAGRLAEIAEEHDLDDCGIAYDLTALPAWQASNALPETEAVAA